jgi:hypothetical protein
MGRFWHIAVAQVAKLPSLKPPYARSRLQSQMVELFDAANASRAPSQLLAANIFLEKTR